MKKKYLSILFIVLFVYSNVFSQNVGIGTTNPHLKNSEMIDFKALNYKELIPIIIKGMQELSKTNDELKKQNENLEQQLLKLEAILNTQQSTANQKLQAINIISAYLQQNSPNPLSKNTVISCYMPSSVNQAQLVVYSNDGKSLKSYPINNR